MLQSLSSDMGQHALVYGGETLLRDDAPTDQSSGLMLDPFLTAETFESGWRAADHRPRDQHQMSSGCLGPFTSLAVLDENALLLVGRQKLGKRRTEVLFLLQRIATDWQCYPLLSEGVEKDGVVLRCFRNVWGASEGAKVDGVVHNSCWIWGLCSRTSGWQDRRWKLTWDVSVRPVEVKVELTNLHSGGFSIPTELEPFSLEQLDRRRLFKTGVKQHLQKSLVSAVGQRGPQ